MRSPTRKSAISVPFTWTSARSRAPRSTSLATGTQSPDSGDIPPESYRSLRIRRAKGAVLAQRIDPVAGPLEVGLQAGKVSPATGVLVGEDPGESVLDRPRRRLVIAQDARDHDRRANTVHGVVDVLVVPRAVGGLPVAELGQSLPARLADSRHPLAQHEVRDQGVLDQVGSDLDAGGMEVRVVPAPLGLLVLEDEAETTPPGVLDLGPPVALVEREDHVEEAHRVAGRVEVRPARIDPAAVGLLRGEEIVDRTPDGGRESVLGQNTVATDQHEGREG